MINTWALQEAGTCTGMWLPGVWRCSSELFCCSLGRQYSRSDFGTNLSRVDFTPKSTDKNKKNEEVRDGLLGGAAGGPFSFLSNFAWLSNQVRFVKRLVYLLPISDSVLPGGLKYFENRRNECVRLARRWCGQWRRQWSDRGCTLWHSQHLQRQKPPGYMIDVFLLFSLDESINSTLAVAHGKGAGNY